MTLEGYPWARLKVPGANLAARDVMLDPTMLAHVGVRESRGFSAGDLVLFVFRFDSEEAAMNAKPGLLDALKSAHALFYARASSTGGYLLLGGTPVDQPPAPERDALLTDLLSAFAGEE
jgi:hypothetical protein